MAASTLGVRVKLFFGDSHLEPSWFNINLKYCKTVSDVEQRIIEKFELSCNYVKLKLSDCRLPPWESAGILRENDSVHVLAEYSAAESESEKKKKKAKKKKRTYDEVMAEDDETTTDTLNTETEFSVKRKNKQTNGNEAPKAAYNEAIEPQRQTDMTEKGDSTIQKVIADEISDGQNVSIVANMSKTDLDDTNQEKKKRKRKRKNKRRDSAPVQENNSNNNSLRGAKLSTPFENTASRNMSFSRTNANKHITFGDEDGPCENIALNGNMTNGQVKDESAFQTEPLYTSSQQEINYEMEDEGSKGQMSTDTSFQNQTSFGTSVTEESVLSSGITVYTRPKRKMSSYKPMSKKRQLETVATNKSFVIVNDTNQTDESETTRKHAEHSPPMISISTSDYSQFSDLDGPPRSGDKIAYKIIELSSNLCPEVSAYKEAHVVSYNPISTVLELQLLTQKSAAPSQMSLDTEGAENNLVSVEWGSLLEPKLLS